MSTSPNKTILIYFASSLAPRLLTFGTTLLLAHTLPSKEFGLLSLVLTLSLVIIALSSSWLSNAAYRFVADRENSDIERIEENILLAFPWSCAAISLLATLIGIWTGQSAVLLISSVVIGLLMGLTDLTCAFLNAQSRPYGYLKVSLLRTGTIFLLVLGVAATGSGLNGAIVCYILGTMAVLISSDFRSVFRNFRVGVPDLASLRENLLFGVPSGIAFNAYILLHAGSRLVLNQQAGHEQVGRFAFSHDLFYAPAALVLGTFGLSYMPKMHSGWLEAGREGALPWINKYLTIQVAGALPILAGGYAIADILWNFVAPQGAMPGEERLAFLATLSGLSLAMFGCFAMIQLVMGRAIVAMVATLFLVVANAVALMAFGNASSLSHSAAVSALCITLVTSLLGTITINQSGARVPTIKIAQVAALSLALCLLLLLLRGVADPMRH